MSTAANIWQSRSSASWTHQM